MKRLLIVESPTKAKTITKYLGSDYTVLSSFGHIRDLPKKEMGVDTKNAFEPTYVVPDDKKKRVTELKKAAKSADEVYLATDEDREGEAIAWHIAEILKLDPKTAKRIAFHEITKPAILKALENPRTLSMDLVDAQQTRRILDRLVGYELSPLLWKKIQFGLSAGRVQSVALRLIVERERERLAFNTDEYWTIEGLFKKDMEFPGKLREVKGKALKKLDLGSKDAADRILADLQGATFTVTSAEKKQRTRKPPTPFKTSTLQQEANNKLGMSAKQTMTLAQKLYETGRITYMRTDSLNLSDEFLNAAQAYIKEAFGDDYAKGVKAYKTTSKGAQEAHEAIRPTNVTLSPDNITGDAGMKKLYALIWSRTLATQMPPAKIERTAIDLTAKDYTFRANGSTIVFDGFMHVYRSAKETLLPELTVGDAVEALTIEGKQHFTEPPPRYSDATLVKILEEHEIGRPSTYAPTISTITNRGYVDRDENKKLYPLDIAMVVNDMLVEHFPDIVDYEFTAEMEKKLDHIAEGKQAWVPMLNDFYTPFHQRIEDKGVNLSRDDVKQARELGTDPQTGKMILAKHGRFGPYLQLGEWSEEDRKEKRNKPKMVSIPKPKLVESITLDEAFDLLSYPKTIGTTVSGDQITLNLGPYGPYLKHGRTNAGVPDEVVIDDIDETLARKIILDDAKRREEMKKPIQEFNSGIQIKNGRFGPYVTDGKVNASISKKYDPKLLTETEALEILEKKRAKKGRKK
ncbi:MAG: type I DNA topoisomerase [bacterium]|nr:type I DNA topoisomerase [bacterium]